MTLATTIIGCTLLLIVVELCDRHGYHRSEYWRERKRRRENQSRGRALIRDATDRLSPRAVEIVNLKPVEFDIDVNDDPDPDDYLDSYDPELYDHTGTGGFFATWRNAPVTWLVSGHGQTPDEAIADCKRIMLDICLYEMDVVEGVGHGD